jgi:hypothetical protein
MSMARGKQLLFGVGVFVLFAFPGVTWAQTETPTPTPEPTATPTPEPTATSTPLPYSLEYVNPAENEGSGSHPWVSEYVVTLFLVYGVLYLILGLFERRLVPFLFHWGAFGVSVLALSWRGAVIVIGMYAVMVVILAVYEAIEKSVS